MTSTDTAPPLGLSFPASVFQKLAPETYLHRHLQSATSLRPSGRKPSQFRPATCHTSSLSHCHGSAVVRTGDTAVVCGVRGEVLSLLHGDGKSRGRTDVVGAGTVEDEVKKYSLVVPNLELGTGCSKDYHPGPPTDYAQAVAEKLRGLLLLAGLVPADTLCIVDGEGGTRAFWVLYVDMVCISLDGNVLDTAWAAMMAALRSTRLPSASWDVDNEAVVCDPNPENYRALGMAGMVFTAGFGVFTAESEEGDGEEAGKEVKWVLSDMDEFEEGVCAERVVVAIRDGDKIAKIEKGGGLTKGPDLVKVCIERAKERYKELEKLLEQS